MGLGQSDFGDAEAITSVIEVSLLRTCSVH